MFSLFKLMRYAQTYKPFVVGNVLSNVFMVVFSLVSVPAIIPFLQILFEVKKTSQIEPPDFAWNAGALLERLDYEMSLLILHYGKPNALLIVCFGVVVVFFLKNLFRYLALAFMAPVRNGIIRDLRRDLFDKMLALPIGYFSEEKKGDLMARISYDVQEIESSILNVLESAVREPLMIIGSLLLMTAISPQLTLVVLVLMLFTGVVVGGISRRLRRKSMRAQTKLGALLSVIEEGLGGLRIVKGFNAERYQADKFKKENDEYREISIHLLWRRELASPLSEFLGVSIMMLLLWYGAGMVFEQTISGETFIAFLISFYNVINPAKNFAGAAFNIQKGLGAVARIEAIQQEVSTIVDADDARSVSGFEKAIEYREVSFGYRPDEPVLQHINLTLPKGKVVALVGVSGSGKTTLADLLPRFFDVQKGQILLDGTDIRRFKMAELRRLMGIVSQEPVLFNDTIFNNITFGYPATEEEVVQAAKIANAHDFIMETPNGYQTNIGDRGAKLSGGQRQRLTIARAILRNPPILILDEATSSLDSESERLVQEALFRLMQNRTALVIAHRLSTIQRADEILVLQEGRIVERGQHDALMAQQGIYRKLVDLQAI
jgi:subfamily B ATP-binding cassette protein MsbA